MKQIEFDEIAAAEPVEFGVALQKFCAGWQPLPSMMVARVPASRFGKDSTRPLGQVI